MSTVDEPTQQPTYPAFPNAQYAPVPHGQPFQQQSAGGMYVQPIPGAPVGHARPMGPVGKIRSTWGVIGLSIITLGLYSLYYYFATHEEMKQHAGEGLGGALGLVLGLFTGGLVTVFALPNEIGNMYARQGRPRPVSATTGLWAILGAFILIGPLVWLIKTNGALNAYWRSVGAH